MPEGLTNAPAAFQRFMNDIFADMIDVIVIIYLDNILIYPDNISEHKLHVREVLCRLCANGIFAHADKCEFHVTSCEYLRYMLSPEGLTMARTKSRLSKIGQYHEKSRTFNPSSAVPISTVISFMDIPKSQSRSHVLPARVPPGISLMSAIQPLKHLKRLSPQLQSLPIGSGTLKLQSRLTPLTMHSLPSFPSRLPMATFTLLHSTPRHSLPQLNYDVHDKEL